MNNKFYTYIALDPRYFGPYFYNGQHLDCIPYYVGKGSGNRINVTLKDKKQKKKFERTEEIIQSGFEPLLIKVKENLTEIESFQFEQYFITIIGREDLNEGVLLNVSNGWEGKSGHKLSEKTRKIMSFNRKGEKHFNYGTAGKNQFEILENNIVKVYLSQEKTCLVDLKHWERLRKYTWYTMKNKNLWNVASQISTNMENMSDSRKSIYMKTMIKDIPEGMKIRIKNGDDFDLREENLELVVINKKILLKTRKKPYKSSKGIIWDFKRDVWIVRIGVNYKKHYLGFYKTLEEAESVAKEFRENLVKKNYK